jgi:hypothetical protein
MRKLDTLESFSWVLIKFNFMLLWHLPAQSLKRREGPLNRAEWLGSGPTARL